MTGAPLLLVISLYMLTMAPCVAKRVIFMPAVVPSHWLLHVDLARIMMERGHDIWLVLPQSVPDEVWINTTGLSLLQYHTTFDVVNDIRVVDPFLAEDRDRVHEAYVRFQFTSHEILNSQTLFEQMKSVRADLFVFDDSEALPKKFAVFPYRLGIPFACLDFSFQPFIRRVPFSPAVTPTFLTNYGPDMTLWERFQNTLTAIARLLNTLYNYEGVVSRYASEMENIPLDILAARAEVWLIGLDPILHLPYPTLPNVKFIGGLAAAPADPLDPVFQSFMDSGKDGVIVVTFGAMFHHLSQTVTEMLMTAFQQMHPMKVVFRVNVTSPDPSQILTSSWLPQNSLLAHPNCRVFVTHCGMNGQYQALYHAVPMLGLPLFYDQLQNAHNMERKGFGIRRDIKKISVEDVVQALHQLKEDGGYRDNITRASHLFRDVYGVPRNTAAYWLEHVMQYGGAYMRSSGQEMALYQFLLLDVLVVLGGCVFVVLGLAYLCVRFLWATFCRARINID